MNKKHRKFGKKYNVTEQYKLPLNKIQNYKTDHQELLKGEFSIISMDTVHSSSDNCSKNLRITALVRIHKILSKDFRSFRDNHTYMDQIKK